MSQTPIDFASLVRVACQDAQQLAKHLGRTFGWDDIERIIRQLDQAHTLPESTPRPKSSNPSPFGDRKAIPPAPEQVTAYSLSIGYPMDGEKWCDHYEEKGWSVGKAGKKMKDWMCAVNNWKTNAWGLGTITLNGHTEKTKDSYDKF